MSRHFRLEGIEHYLNDAGLKRSRVPVVLCTPRKFSDHVASGGFDINGSALCAT